MTPPPPRPRSRQVGAVSPQRMKASECTRLQAESSLRGELERRGQRLQELAEERVRALQGLHEVGGRSWGRRGRLGNRGRGSGPPLHGSRKKAASWSSAGAWTRL